MPCLKLDVQGRIRISGLICKAEDNEVEADVARMIDAVNARPVDNYICHTRRVSAVASTSYCFKLNAMILQAWTRLYERGNMLAMTVSHPRAWVGCEMRYCKQLLLLHRCR